VPQFLMYSLNCLPPARKADYVWRKSSFVRAHKRIWFVGRF